jgi:hypothetical protein
MLRRLLGLRKNITCFAGSEICRQNLREYCQNKASDNRAKARQRQNIKKASADPDIFSGPLVFCNVGVRLFCIFLLHIRRALQELCPDRNLDWVYCILLYFGALGNIFFRIHCVFSENCDPLYLVFCHMPHKIYCKTDKKGVFGISSQHKENFCVYLQRNSHKTL